jgi:glycosyltransferase involved in cell wall biosynthesis
MHIGLLIYGTLDLPSGGFLYDRQVVKALAALGDRVSVIELPWRSYRRSLLDNLDEALAFQLASGSWEVLVQDELAHPSLVRTNRRVQQLSRRRFPIISLVHLLHSTSRPWESWRGWLYRQVERRYLQSVDGCIYVSRHTRRESEALLGAARPSVVAYPAGDHLDPGRQPAETAKPSNPGDPLQIFFLGSVVPRKALHTLLAALPTLADLDWRLRVAGSLQEDPAYAGRMQSLAAEAPLRGRVTFLGALSPPDVSQELAASQVLVLPSYAEGYPIACLEAMAHGLPVIAPAASGAAELVQDGHNGYLLPPDDAPALAGHLRRLAGDPQLRRRLGEHARRTFRSHPTWQDTAGVIHEFLAAQVAAWQVAARHRQPFLSIEQ